MLISRLEFWCGWPVRLKNCVNRVRAPVACKFTSFSSSSSSSSSSSHSWTCFWRVTYETLHSTITFIKRVMIGMQSYACCRTLIAHMGCVEHLLHSMCVLDATICDFIKALVVSGQTVNIISPFVLQLHTRIYSTVLTVRLPSQLTAVAIDCLRN